MVNVKFKFPLGHPHTECFVSPVDGSGKKKGGAMGTRLSLGAWLLSEPKV